MIPLTHRIRHWFASEDVLVECRNCGTTLEAGADVCLECDSTEISRYDLG